MASALWIKTFDESLAMGFTALQAGMIADNVVRKVQGELK